MRVFVAGGTGVAGKRAVARLVAAGHEVTGIARTPEKAALLEILGASPVTADLFDAEALRAAVAGHDAVVNLATKIPPITRATRENAWAENDRIRRVASGLLADAAISAGVQVFVQESLAFLYGEHGAEPVDAATTPMMDDPTSTEACAIAERNAARVTEAGGRGVVLRFGRFYAPDSSHSVTQVQRARGGWMADVGAPDGYAPQIDADDVARAVVAALDAPAGTYDIVDDQPLTRREQADAMARAVGRARLHLLPRWLGGKAAAHLSSSQRVSNTRFREATGWRPSSPDVRFGYRKMVAEMHVEPALPGRARLMLWILALAALGVGVQAAFTPRSFYDDFPFGRGWVAMDGRYNQHLIRDVGELNLALLVLTLAALFYGTRVLARVTAVSWLVYSVPHLVYHSRHLSMPMDGWEKVVLLGSLSVPVLAALVILFTKMRGPDDATVYELTSPREARALRVSRA